jgi:hypothetical protein
MVARRRARSVRSARSVKSARSARTKKPPSTRIKAVFTKSGVSRPVSAVEAARRDAAMAVKRAQASSVSRVKDIPVMVTRSRAQVMLGVSGMHGVTRTGAEPNLHNKWNALHGPGHVVTSLSVLENGSHVALHKAFSAMSKNELAEFINSVQDMEYDGNDKHQMVHEAMKLFKQKVKEACHEHVHHDSESFKQMRKMAIALDPSLASKSKAELCRFFHQEMGFASKLAHAAKGGIGTFLGAVMDKGSAMMLQRRLKPTLDKIAKAVDNVGISASEAFKNSTSVALASCRTDGRHCFAALMSLQKEFCNSVELAPFNVKLRSIVSEFIANANVNIAPEGVGGVAARIVGDLARGNFINMPVFGKLSTIDRETKSAILKNIRTNRAVIEKSLKAHLTLCTALTPKNKGQCVEEYNRMMNLMDQSPERFLSQFT